MTWFDEEQKEEEPQKKEGLSIVAKLKALFSKKPKVEEKPEEEASSFYDTGYGEILGEDQEEEETQKKVPFTKWEIAVFVIEAALILYAVLVFTGIIGF